MAVIVEAHVLGVSTRRVEDLVQSLGIEKLSKSTVSELAKELDGVVSAFRERKLTGRYRYIWLDALMIKNREGGRVANVACLIATGVNEEGRREILGLEVNRPRTGPAGWPSSVVSKHGALKASNWPPRTRIRASRMRSLRCCAGRAGNDAGRISCAIC